MDILEQKVRRAREAIRSLRQEVEHIQSQIDAARENEYSDEEESPDQWSRTTYDEEIAKLLTQIQKEKADAARARAEAQAPDPTQPQPQPQPQAEPLVLFDPRLDLPPPPRRR